MAPPEESGWIVRSARDVIFARPEARTSFGVERGALDPPPSLKRSARIKHVKSTLPNAANL
jgi:hypothetical protein